MRSLLGALVFLLLINAAAADWAKARAPNGLYGATRVEKAGAGSRTVFESFDFRKNGLVRCHRDVTTQTPGQAGERTSSDTPMDWRTNGGAVEVFANFVTDKEPWYRFTWDDDELVLTGTQSPDAVVGQRYARP